MADHVVVKITIIVIILFFFLTVIQAKLYYAYRVLNKFGNGHYTNWY